MDWRGITFLTAVQVIQEDVEANEPRNEAERQVYETRRSWLNEIC